MHGERRPRVAGLGHYKQDAAAQRAMLASLRVALDEPELEGEADDSSGDDDVRHVLGRCTVQSAAAVVEHVSGDDDGLDVCWSRSVQSSTAGMGHGNGDGDGRDVLWSRSVQSTAAVMGHHIGDGREIYVL